MKIETFEEEVWRVMSTWLKKLLAVSSQAINALVLNGKTTQTIGSRAYSQSSSSKAWSIVEQVLNTFFWFDENHCKQQYMANSTHLAGKQTCGPS